MMNNKDKILIAAMELFHDQGFQATGLEDILTSSGVCKSNFYYHFKSKDELGIQAIESKVMQMRDRFMEPSLDNRSLNPRERILSLFARMLAFCEEQSCRKGCFFGNMALELSDHREELRKPLSLFFAELEEKIEGCLQECFERGELRAGNMTPRELALPMVAMLQGSLLMTKVHKDSAALRSSIKLLSVLLGE